MLHLQKNTQYLKTFMFWSFLACSLSSCSSLQAHSVNKSDNHIAKTSDTDENTINWERPFGIDVGTSPLSELTQQLNKVGVDTSAFDITENDITLNEIFETSEGQFFHEGIFTKMPRWQTIYISLENVNIESAYSNQLSQFDYLYVFIDEKKIIQKLSFWSKDFDVFASNITLLKKQYPKQLSPALQPNSLFRVSQNKSLLLKTADIVSVEVTEKSANIHSKNLISFNYQVQGDLSFIPKNFTHKLSTLGYSSQYNFEDANQIKASDWKWYTKNITVQIVSPKYEQVFERLLCQKLKNPNTSDNEKMVLKESLAGYCKSQ